MYVRYCLSAFAVAARRRRPARVAGEPATRAAKERADDYIQRGSRERDDRCLVRGGYDSAKHFLDGDGARSAGPGNPKYNADAGQFRPRGTGSKIAPGARSRVPARDLSLARHRTPESAHLA